MANAPKPERRTRTTGTKPRGWLTSQSNGVTTSHACNCIGCCPKCGTCRTWPGHTEAYCELLQRQARERTEFLARERVA